MEGGGACGGGAIFLSSRVTLCLSLLCVASCSASSRAYWVCRESRLPVIRSTFSSISLGSGPCAATCRRRGVEVFISAGRWLESRWVKDGVGVPPGPAARPSSGSASPSPPAEPWRQGTPSAPPSGRLWTDRTGPSTRCS